MLFEAGLRLTGVGRRLQAGEYAYPARASMWQVADTMARGESVLHRITLVEGITVRQAVALLQRNELLTGSLATMPAGRLAVSRHLFLSARLAPEVQSSTGPKPG